MFIIIIRVQLPTQCPNQIVNSYLVYVYYALSVSYILLAARMDLVVLCVFLSSFRHFFFRIYIIEPFFRVFVCVCFLQLNYVLVCVYRS